jgi:hypothetical protein
MVGLMPRTFSQPFADVFFVYLCTIGWLALPLAVFVHPLAVTQTIARVDIVGIVARDDMALDVASVQHLIPAARLVVLADILLVDRVAFVVVGREMASIVVSIPTATWGEHALLVCGVHLALLEGDRAGVAGETSDQE